MVIGMETNNSDGLPTYRIVGDAEEMWRTQFLSSAQ